MSVLGALNSHAPTQTVVVLFRYSSVRRLPSSVTELFLILLSQVFYVLECFSGLDVFDTAFRAVLGLPLYFLFVVHLFFAVSKLFVQFFMKSSTVIFKNNSF